MDPLAVALVRRREALNDGRFTGSPRCAIGCPTMRSLLFLISLLVATVAFAQQPPAPAKQDPALLAEINRDIWLPFSEAYLAGDVERYLTLHRPDFIRGEGSRKTVRSLESYAADVRRSFARWNEQGLKIEIAFRFHERLVSREHASERGVFQFTVTRPDGKTQKFHGQFHTFARKVEGRWQFVVDYDSDEGGTIDEAKFLAGAAVDDFSRF